MLVIDKIKHILTLPVDQFEEGWFEPHTTNCVKRLVKPGWVCYDVGANEGWYTTLFALLAKANGHVIAFEPMMSKTVRILAVELEALPEATAPVQCHDVALTNAINVGIKKVKRVRTDAWTLQESTGDGCVDVQYAHLDSMVRTLDLPAPNIIKIDVDGDEPHVLAGASATIEVHRPTIVLEVAPDYNNLQGQDLLPSLLWLKGLGYRFHRDDNNVVVRPEEVKALVCAWSSINLICMP